MRKTICFLLVAPSLLLADDVHLKGAGMLSGQIVEQTDTMVKVNVGDGVIGVPMSRVERIDKRRSPLDDYAERAAKLAPQDAKGWRSLGHWAGQQGLSAQSREAYEKVIAVAPDDEQARQALGYVRIDGRWLTEEESYPARGYVKYDGEWMMPAEAQAAQASAAADRAKDEAEQRALDADIAAREAAARAEETAEREREEARNDSWSSGYSDYPVYWGGWGYGVTTWPSHPVVRDRPVDRPVQRPSTPVRGGRGR